MIYRLTIGWNLAQEKRSYLIVIIISFVITTFINYKQYYYYRSYLQLRWSPLDVTIVLRCVSSLCQRSF